MRAPAHLPETDLLIKRSVHQATFFDVNSRSSGGFGFENGPWEAWVYPLKTASDIRFDFQAANGDSARDTDNASSIEARPESFTRIISANTFTVREVFFAPATEPGIIVLLELDTLTPLTVRVSCRPQVSLMWPAPSPAPLVGFSPSSHAVMAIADSGDRRYVSFAGAAGAQASDTPMAPGYAGFRFTVTPQQARDGIFPVVFTGSLTGEADARARLSSLETNAVSLYAATVEYFREFLARSVAVSSDDPRLDAEFRWAEVSVHRALVANPMLGLGLVAGYSVSDDNNRPGFGWFFGRDSAWAALATSAAGDLEASRSALDFLSRFQRTDGKIPHEISQSAALVPWFTDFPYPWASADSTPLYIAAWGDYWRITGDTAALRAHWPSIQKAYRFARAMDTDHNLLIENGPFGHGWIEGGPLFPAHEESYLEGVWIEALRCYGQMARAVGDSEAAGGSDRLIGPTVAKVESTYWLPDAGYYSYATLPGGSVGRQLTVLPDVPMWWRELNPEHARAMLIREAAHQISTDWGTRIVSNDSRVYNPVLYHAGSVWPLFTGWAAMAAYRYQLPELGYRWLRQNGDQEFKGPAGEVDEFFSGDLYRPQSESSHHQTWSSAMVVSPMLRGLVGLHWDCGPHTLCVSPQLPPGMHRLDVERIPCGRGECDLHFSRDAGEWHAVFSSTSGYSFAFSPGLPADTRILGAELDGHRLAPVARPQVEGDVLSATWMIPGGQALPRVARARAAEAAATAPGAHTFRLHFMAGAEIWVAPRTDTYGSRSHRLLIVSREYEPGVLRLQVEGIAGTHDCLHYDGAVIAVEGGTLDAGSHTINVVMPGQGTGYTSTQLVLHLRAVTGSRGRGILGTSSDR
jgi:glycogen debranching enzyme